MPGLQIFSYELREISGKLDQQKQLWGKVCGALFGLCGDVSNV